MSKSGKFQVGVYAFLFWMAIAWVAACPANADDTGFFIGASLGQSFIRDSFTDFEDEEFSFNEEDLGYRIFFGYRPLKILAVEAGWRDFGTPDKGLADIGRVKYENTAFDAFVVGILPIWILEIRAKAGVGLWDAKVKAMGSGFSDDGQDFMWGAGINVQLASFGIRAEWEQLETDHPETLGMASVGLTYTF